MSTSSTLQEGIHMLWGAAGFDLVRLQGHNIAEGGIYLHRDLGTSSKPLGWATGTSVVVSDPLWNVVSSRLRVHLRPWYAP